MLLVLFAIALSVGLASCRPSDQAIGHKYCACIEQKVPQCGCCIDMMEVIKEDYTLCANISYIQSESKARFTLKINDEVLFDETISGENPPPFCRGIIGVANLCVKVYNMSYEEQKFGGCLDIYSTVVTRVFDLKLGCHYLKGVTGFPGSDAEVLEVPSDELSGLHSLFQIGNSAKEQILHEMHKWSYKDGDVGVAENPKQRNFPKEPVVGEYEP